MPNYAEAEPDLTWKKPEWTKNNGLRPTGMAQKMKEGNLAAPITSLPHQKENGPFEKPEWTEEVSAKEGTRIRQDPAKPITALPHIVAEKNLSFEKPAWTKEVSAKEGTRIQQDPAKPITALPHISADKNLAFEKPAWTKDAGLQATGKGQALKAGKEIARPIGGIKPVDEE